MDLPGWIINPSEFRSFIDDVFGTLIKGHQMSTQNLLGHQYKLQ